MIKGGWRLETIQTDSVAYLYIRNPPTHVGVFLLRGFLDPASVIGQCKAYYCIYSAKIPVIKNYSFFVNNVVALGAIFLLMSWHGKPICSSSHAFAIFCWCRHHENQGHPRIMPHKQYVGMCTDRYEFNVWVCRIF